VEKIAKSEYWSKPQSPKEPGRREIKVRTGYSLTGITWGLMMKRSGGTSGKTFGLFDCDWIKWITVETAFDLDL
jgi:hypothetical protein